VGLARSHVPCCWLPASLARGTLIASYS
jgi:hypothetical protein